MQHFNTKSNFSQIHRDMNHDGKQICEFDSCILVWRMAYCGVRLCLYCPTSPVAIFPNIPSRLPDWHWPMALFIPLKLLTKMTSISIQLLYISFMFSTIMIARLGKTTAQLSTSLSHNYVSAWNKNVIIWYKNHCKFQHHEYTTTRAPFKLHKPKFCQAWVMGIRASYSRFVNRH